MGGRRRRWRQLVFPFALSLVLGLITTWAVAWSCAYFVLLDFSVYRSPAREVWVIRGQGWGREAFTVFADYPPDYIGSDEHRAAAVHLPTWSESRIAFQRGSPAPSRVPRHDSWGRQHGHWLELAAGWPALCLRGQRTSDTATPGALLLFRNKISPRSNHWRDTLPYWPIWSGLLLNVVFYAALWFALLTVPRFMHRRLLLRRGVCPKCRYDLRRDLAAGCPECGWGRGSEPR